VILLVSLAGCSTMNKLNPFSSEDETAVTKPSKTNQVKMKKLQCYAWDASGRCAVW
jgi:hypothetical protein